MDIKRRSVPGEEGAVPAILIKPAHPRGAAIIMHGYGGNKEEQLGLGFVAAEAGLAACVIDLRGHGEHPLPLDEAIGADIGAVLHFCSQFGKVTAIGHSLGGRLALTSDADYHIAISPSLSLTYGEHTKELLRTLRSYRVRPPDLSVLLSVQENIPVWDPATDAGNTLILFAERDAPEISAGCMTLRSAGVRVVQVTGAMHGDIFLLEQTFAAVREQILQWYGRGT
jgi:alpha-beta hydrolase superfamily lysophospholipase